MIFKNITYNTSKPHVAAIYLNLALYGESIILR